MNTNSQSLPVPTEHWAQIGTLDVRYLDWGGEGPPLLALHGLASSAHWYELVAPYLQSKHRVIAPDQRGHGQTSQANKGYDWQSLASDAVGLLDHLGISRGATVALNLGIGIRPFLGCYGCAKLGGAFPGPGERFGTDRWRRLPQSHAERCGSSDLGPS